jgi:FlaA1/EpsC-like NDP-sugar epimerase
VKVLSLARRLWEQCDSQEREFAVEYIGMRQGERLAEPLLTPTEAWEMTEFPGVMRVVETGSRPPSTDTLAPQFARWERLVAEEKRGELREQLFAVAQIGLPQSGDTERRRT